MLVSRLFRLTFLFVMLFSVALAPAGENQPTLGLEAIGARKLPTHPRLFLTQQREAEIKELMKTDAFLDNQVKELLKKADRAMKDKPSEYLIPDGLRLLGQSRRSLDRTSVLAFAYRMTGKKEYAEKAIEEMLTVCRFQDWNPKHYLDTAEMAAAVGIGYDWLYDVLTPEQKDEIRAGMVKHALQTGLSAYEKNRGWPRSHTNWNEVCNAGLTIGALAIADEEPELAEKIVAFAVKSLPNGLSAYKPDGAYPEGPVYWGYGASFTGLMLKVLDDVFKSDFGLLKTEGLSVTGDYYMGIIGPNYTNYNYADGGEGVDSSPMMYALSTFYDRSDYAAWLRTFLAAKKRYQSGRLVVFHAIWYNPKGVEGSLEKTPRAVLYRGIQDVCTMRTAWGDPDAAFIGFKAGNNRANHAHLDIGSFVYEVNGVRWAVELGTDNYNLPGYFGKGRWNYFRLNNRSHSTLVIGDKIQNPAADCKMIAFETNQNGQVARAVADLTDAYKGQCQTARRTVTLLEDGGAVIEDVLEGVAEPVRWALVTKAAITLGDTPGGDKNATLTQDKKKLDVMLSSDQVEKFEIVSAAPPTEQENPNKGVSILAAVARPESGKVMIRVTLKPGQ